MFNFLLYTLQVSQTVYNEQLLLINQEIKLFIEKQKGHKMLGIIINNNLDNSKISKQANNPVRACCPFL